MRRSLIVALLGFVAVSCAGSDDAEPIESVDVTTPTDDPTDDGAGDDLFTASDDSSGPAQSGGDAAATTTTLDADASGAPADQDGAVDGAVDDTVPGDDQPDDDQAGDDQAGDDQSGGNTAPSDPSGGTSGDGAGSTTTSTAPGGATSGGGTTAGGVASIDQSILLDAGELAAFGLGDDWQIDVTIEPGVATVDGGICNVDLITRSEHLYADAQNAGGEVEQAIIPGAGPTVVEVVAGLATCRELADDFGGEVQSRPLTISGTDDAVSVSVTVFDQSIRWAAADVGGVGIVFFYAGETDPVTGFDSAFESLVAATVASL